MLKLTHQDLMQSAALVAQTMVADMGNLSGKRLYGIPRGGIPAVYLLRGILSGVEIVESPEQADVFIDDLIDSGTTKKDYAKRFPKIPFYGLHKKTDNRWIVFPWESTEETSLSATDIPLRLLQFIGEDCTRGGLQDTPQRFLSAWREWTSGYDQNPNDLIKVFEDGAESYDEMIIVRGINFYSHCEHHLAPFFGTIDIGYIPQGKIIGLSKLARVSEIYSRRLQVQERLTRQIAEWLNENLNPTGVAVVIKARHLCMESRGICKPGSETLTSAVLGALKENTAARAEFLELCRT